MAAQQPYPSPTLPSNSNRRASWARAFHRVRDAMKRANSSSTAAFATVARHAHPSQEHTATTADPIDTTAATLHPPEETTNCDASRTPSSSTNVIAPDAPIPVDDVQDHGPDDDSYSPVFFPQMHITDERAHDIFARYNLSYHPRGKQPQSEPPAKIRRVEKPIRLRVHWTCHECRTQFGIERVCANCGHRRCRSCERHPPKRLKNADESRQRAGERVETQVEEQQATSGSESAQETMDTPLAEGESTAVDPDLAPYREEPAAAPIPRNDTPPRESSTISALPIAADETSAVERLLEVDDEADEDYQKLRSIQLTMYTRPRDAVQTVVQTSKRPMRRTCHECSSPLSNNRNECLNCGHGKCTLCTPRPGLAATEEDEVPTFKGVKRVYRKPRQRVRYKCEHCNLQMESDRCAECGHQRCDSCHREPPRRQQRAHNAEILAAVADRLAAYGGGRSIAGPSPAVPTV